MLSHRNRKHLYTAIASTLMLAGPSAWAQMEEVMVTAQKRSESMQDTPIAISAMVVAERQARGSTDFRGVAMATPSLTQSPYPSSDMLILYLRGQGVANPMEVTSDGSVGLYVDGFYIARPQGALFDLAEEAAQEAMAQALSVPDTSPATRARFTPRTLQFGLEFAGVGVRA